MVGRWWWVVGAKRRRGVRDVCGWMGVGSGCVDPRRRQQRAHHPSPTSHRTCGDGGEQRVATGMHIAIMRYIGHVYRATHSLTSAPMVAAKGKTAVHGGKMGGGGYGVG